jgi:Flp pilus assembly CpaE family ATPase
LAREAVRTVLAHQARVEELQAQASAELLTPALLARKAEAIRRWTLAIEHACSLSHAVALDELADASPAQQERARTFLSAKPVTWCR